MRGGRATGRGTAATSEGRRRQHFGDSTLLTGSARGQALRVRVSARTGAAARAGDEVVVGWRVDDMHVIGAPPATGVGTQEGSG